MNSSLRYLNPVLTDRVNHLIENTYTSIPLPKLSKCITHAEYREKLETYEIELMKKNGFNFMIKNVPQYAQNSLTRKDVKVTYAALRDTFNEFGDVKKICVFKGTVFLIFKTQNQAKETHDLINNMQIGKNIVKTKAI